MAKVPTNMRAPEVTLEQRNAIRGHLDEIFESVAAANTLLSQWQEGGPPQILVENLDRIRDEVDEVLQSLDPRPSDHDFFRLFVELCEVSPKEAAYVATIWRRAVTRMREKNGGTSLRRRYHVTVIAGADEWDGAMRQLSELVAHLAEHGAKCEVVTGASSSDGSVEVEHDPSMTPERYQAELEARE
jgi:sugar phosphate isomerase/epimerase